MTNNLAAVGMMFGAIHNVLGFVLLLVFAAVCVTTAVAHTLLSGRSGRRLGQPDLEATWSATGSMIWNGPGHHNAVARAVRFPGLPMATLPQAVTMTLYPWGIRLGPRRRVELGVPTFDFKYGEITRADIVRDPVLRRKGLRVSSSVHSPLVFWGSAATEGRELLRQAGVAVGEGVTRLPMPRPWLRLDGGRPEG